MIGLQEPGKFAGRCDQFEKWKDQLVKWISLVDPRHEDLVRATIDKDADFTDDDLMEEACTWVNAIWGRCDTDQAIVERCNEVKRLSRSMSTVISNLVEGTADIMLKNLQLQCGYQAL